MKDLAYDWVTKDGACYVKDNGIAIYKVTCKYGIYWAELLDKTLGYKEDGATTTSWSEMYYRLNAAHWERHAHRLAKELADAIAGDVKGQAEVLAQTAKMSSSLQYMLDDPLAVVHFPDPPPAYPEAEWHGGR